MLNINLVKKISIKKLLPNYGLVKIATGEDNREFTNFNSGITKKPFRIEFMIFLFGEMTK